MMTLKFLIYQKEYSDFLIKEGISNPRELTFDRCCDWDVNCYKSYLKTDYMWDNIEDRRKTFLIGRLNPKTGKPLNDIQ